MDILVWTYINFQPGSSTRALMFSRMSPEWDNQTMFVQETYQSYHKWNLFYQVGLIQKLTQVFRNHLDHLYSCDSRRYRRNTVKDDRLHNG